MAKKENSFTDRTVVGLAEKITLKHNGAKDELQARIDSGATRSSMDISLASQLKVGPIVETRVIKSANGARMRPIVKATVIIGGKEITETFTLADRSHMKYKVLIGQNILKRGFLIDPNK